MKHHAALPLRELNGFIKTLRGQPGVAAQALEFAILTGARTGEVIGAKWSEMGIATATWTVPATRIKSGLEHRVPLSDRALEILAVAGPTRCEGDSHVFATDTGKRPLSNMALLAVLRRMGRDDVTTHGFRSVFRDGAAETGRPRDLAEAALAHVVENKVEAAYLRTTLFERRREMMKDWANACAQ